MSRRREDAEEHNSNDRWLVSYADFITLMFAFFAILYATSQKDMDKTKEFQESLKRYLIKAGQFGGPAGPPQINQGMNNNAAIEPPIQTFNQAKPETSKVRDEAEEFLETNLSHAEQDKYIADIISDEIGVRIVIPSDAIFATGNDKFREDAMGFLARLTSLAKKTRRKILIEGHSSEDEKGSFKSTWDFTSARAINMLRYMQQKEKFEGSQLAAAAFGDSRPVLEAKDLKKNSRIEVIILNADVEL